MSGRASSTTSPRQFSIEDAFEEDHEDAIRVYGATSERSPLKPKSRLGGSSQGPVQGDGAVDGVVVRVEDPSARGYSRSAPAPPPGQGTNNVSNSAYKLKFSDDTASKDSDSLIQESAASGMFDPTQAWWQHPKIRENWKMVLAAFVLLLIGVGLVVTGVIVVSLPIHGVQAFVFFIAGAICFIPGAYHVIYIYLAVKGKRGYDFYHLPLFN